jgi:hypothetical protein
MSSWAADMALSMLGIVLRASELKIPVYIQSIQCSVITARNQLAHRALVIEPNVTHLLWWDADITAPSNALERLLAHDKDVVGAFYTRRMPPYIISGHLYGNPDVSKGGLYRASLMPHGLVLVKRSVYERLNGPWYWESFDRSAATSNDPFGLIGEDANFSNYCTRNNIEMYCDTDLTFETGHIGETTFTCDRPQPQHH